MTPLRTIPVRPTFAPRVPRHVASRTPARFADGFYGDEQEHGVPFQWMQTQGVLRFEPAAADRYLELEVYSGFRDVSQELTARTTRDEAAFPLMPGWSPVSIRIPAGDTAVALAANKIYPREYYPQDPRDLAVRIRRPFLHDDPFRHRQIRGRALNVAHNTRELHAGRTVLDSTPTSLGIDLHATCNIKPPCVYCEWDFNKEQEGDLVDVPFTPDTLDEWGPIFDNSAHLVNCSIGEPFMMRDLDRLLDIFGDSGKSLEMSTNGQLLTDRNIERLLGRQVRLYVSLDAATPETYARLRNTRFEVILANLRRLIGAKGGRGPLPHIYLVFMPMRANVHELPAFVDLCASLDVDRLILRPLQFSTATALSADRGGYHFDYQHELLPFEELVRASGRAAELCEQAGVDLADQMDLGGALDAHFARLFEEGRQSARPRSASTAPMPDPAPVSPGVDPPPEAPAVEPAPAAALPSLGDVETPACTEPWRSLYILRRGVFPCCYGGRPLAPMTDYRDVWNAPIMRDIRRDLAAGRFHAYCLESEACPIVRKARQTAEAGPAAEPDRAFAALAASTRRATGLRPRARRAAARARRLLADPAYARTHARRLWARLTRAPRA